jgi:hypothetical protein
MPEITEHIDYKTIRIIDNEGQIAEGLTSIKFIDTDSLSQIGGGVSYWYRLKEDFAGNAESDFEIYFGDSAPNGEGWTKVDEATIEIGDGYYKIAYNLSDLPIMRVKVVIDSEDEEEYSQEILIDFDEMNTILINSRALTRMMEGNASTSSIKVDFNNGNGEFELFLNKPTPIPNDISYSSISPKIKFIRNLESKPDIYLSQELISRKNTRIEEIQTALGLLQELVTDLTGLDGSWSNGEEAFTNVGVDVENNSKTIVFTTEKDTFEISEDDILLINNSVFTSKSDLAYDAENESNEYNCIVNELPLFSQLNVTSNVRKATNVTDSYQLKTIYVNILLLINNEIISNISDIKKTTVAESILACKSLGISLVNEKKVVKKEILEKTDYLQKLQIEKISDLNNIINLQLQWSRPTLKVDPYTFQNIQIIGYDIALFQLNPNLVEFPTSEQVLSYLTGLSRCSSYNFAEKYEENKSSEISKKDYIRKNIRTLKLVRSELAGTITGTISTDEIETSENNFSNTDLYRYNNGNSLGSIIEINDILYSIKEITSAKKAVLSKNLHKTITSSDKVYKRTKYPSYISDISETTITFNYPINITDHLVVFIRAIDEFNNIGNWSNPVVFNSRLLSLTDTNLGSSLNDYLNKFIVDSKIPNIVNIETVPQKPNTPSLQSLSTKIYDVMDEISIDGTLTDIATHRSALEALIETKDALLLSIEQKKLDYKMAKSSTAMATAFTELNQLLYKASASDPTSTLEYTLEQILNYQHLVNYIDNPLYARYNCLVKVTSDPTDTSPSTTIKQYKIQVYNKDGEDEDKLILDNTVKIFEGKEVIPVDYNSFEDKFTYETVTENNVIKTPVYAREIRFPIIPNVKYYGKICVISEYGVASDWSEEFGAITLALDITKPYDMISTFIDARVALGNLRVNQEIELARKEILSLKETLGLYNLKEPTIGEIVATYTPGTVSEGDVITYGYWEYLVIYENVPLIVGFGIKSYYSLKASLEYWSLIGVLNTVEFNNLKNSITWTPTESKLKDFLSLKIYGMLYGDLTTDKEEFDDMYASPEDWNDEYADSGVEHFFTSFPSSVNTTNKKLNYRLNLMSTSNLQFKLELYNDAQYKLVTDQSEELINYS